MHACLVVKYVKYYLHARYCRWSSKYVKKVKQSLYSMPISMYKLMILCPLVEMSSCLFNRYGVSSLKSLACARKIVIVSIWIQPVLRKTTCKTNLEHEVSGWKKDSWIVKNTYKQDHPLHLIFIILHLSKSRQIKHLKENCIFTGVCGDLSHLNQLSGLNASLKMLSSFGLFCSTKLNKKIEPCLHQTNDIPGQENKSVWKIYLVSETDKLQSIDSMSLILDHGLVNNYLCSLSYKAVYTNLGLGYWRVLQEDLHHLLSHA